MTRAPVKNAEEEKSVTELYLQCQLDAVEARARVDMIDQARGLPCILFAGRYTLRCSSYTAVGIDLSAMLQMMGEPCYDTLRTKQQLGYTVHSGTRLTHGVIGFCVVVASGEHLLLLLLKLPAMYLQTPPAARRVVSTSHTAC